MKNTINLILHKIINLLKFFNKNLINFSQQFIYFIYNNLLIINNNINIISINILIFLILFIYKFYFDLSFVGFIAFLSSFIIFALITNFIINNFKYSEYFIIK